MYINIVRKITVVCCSSEGKEFLFSAILSDLLRNRESSSFFTAPFARREEVSVSTIVIGFGMFEIV